MTARRKFTPEYRGEAAYLVIDTDRPIAHVARELGLGEQLLGGGVHQERARLDGPNPGESQGELDTNERAELARLRREAQELRADNEFLGKAAAFFTSHEVYGAPRIRAELAAQGLPLNVKTVAVSMRRQGLAGVSPRVWRPVTTIPGVSTHTIPDLVQRSWDTGELNRVWISDITYLHTNRGCGLDRAALQPTQTGFRPELCH